MGTPLSREDIRQYRAAMRATELAEARIRTYLLAQKLMSPDWLKHRVISELARMIQFDDTDS